MDALAFLAERLFPEESVQAPLETRLDDVLLDGSFFDSVSPRLEMWAYGVSTGIFLQGGMAFAAFLLGLRAQQLAAEGSKACNRKVELRPLLG